MTWWYHTSATLVDCTRRKNCLQPEGPAEGNRLPAQLVFSACHYCDLSLNDIPTGMISSILPILRASPVQSYHSANFTLTGRIYEGSSSITNCNRFFCDLHWFRLRAFRRCQGHRQRTGNSSSLRSLWRWTMPTIVWRKREELSTRLWRRPSAEFSVTKTFLTLERKGCLCSLFC